VTKDNLVNKATKGLAWSYLSTATNAFFNIGFAAIMARLLAPSAFGLFAMAQVVMRFGQYFSQMGIGSALVQKPELSKRDIGTAWLIILSASAAMFCIIWAIAPFAALFFKSDGLTPILRGAAVALILQAAASIPLSILRRDMDFKVYMVIEVSSYVLGYGTVGILCALNNLGVWSLVWAQIGQASVQLVVACLVVRCPIVPCWDKAGAKQLFSFGGKVSIISFLEYLSGSLDTLLAGRFFGDMSLGYYNRGKMVSMLPLYSVSNSLGRVLFPLYSRLNDDEDGQREIFRKGFFLLCTLLLPAAAGISALSPMIVRILLGPNWDATVPVVGICAFAMVVNLLANPLAILCEARALLKRKIAIQFVRIITMLIFFWAFMGHGLVGIAYAYLVCQIFVFISYLVALREVVSPWVILSATLPGVVIALSASLGSYSATLLENLPLHAHWGLQVVGFVLCAAFSLFLPPLKNTRCDLINLAKNGFHRLKT